MSLNSLVDYQPPQPSFTYFNTSRRRARRARGGNLMPFSEQKKNNYYLSIKKATSGAIPLNYDSLTETPEFLEFDFACQ